MWMFVFPLPLFSEPTEFSLRNEYLMIIAGLRQSYEQIVAIAICWKEMRFSFQNRFRNEKEFFADE